MKCLPSKFLLCFFASIFVAHAVCAEDEELDFSNEEVVDDADASFDEETEFDDEMPDDAPAKESVAEKDQNVNAQEKQAATPSEDPADKNQIEEQAKEPVVEEPVEELQPIDEVAPVAQPEKPVESESEPVPEPVQELNEPLTVANENASDDPDYNYEAELHDIYVKYHKDGMSSEQWDSLLSGKSSERYQIRSGDNLWSISRTIFGDGNYWPKIWSLNESIQNPHLITPQNSIRFILGDESSPPSFTVTENAADGASTSTPSASNPAEIYQKMVESMPPVGTVGSDDDTGPEIPPPLKVSRPVVKKIPPSLPAWQISEKEGEYDELGIDYGRRKILDIEDSMFLSGYISEKPPQPLGHVSEVEIGSRLASSYQYIYVTMKKNKAQIGDVLLAVADRGPLLSANDSVEGFLGYSVDVLGEIQLVEQVENISEDSDEGNEIFRALVLKIINPVNVGATLIYGSIERVQVTDQGPRSHVVAQIIGGSFFNKRQVYGDESIAFINRGSKHGVEVGQIMPIRANRRLRNPDTAIESNVIPIGWLRVVKTTPNFSTTVIVKAWSDIFTGDLTGAGSLSSKTADAKRISPEDEDTPKKSLIEELDTQ